MAVTTICYREVAAPYGVRPVTEQLTWATLTEAFLWHAELSPCAKTCTCDHLLIAADAQGRQRVYRLPHPHPQRTEEITDETNHAPRGKK